MYDLTTRYAGLIISPDEAELKNLVMAVLASDKHTQTELLMYTYSRLTNSGNNIPIYAVRYESLCLEPRSKQGRAIIASFGDAPWLWQCVEEGADDEDDVEEACSPGWWERDWTAYATLPCLKVHVEIMLEIGLVDPEDYIKVKKKEEYGEDIT